MQITIKSNIKDLIPNYLDNRQKDVGRLTELLASSDFDEIRAIAHNMKGIGAPYGFQFITDIGLEIENAAKAGNADEIRRLLDRFVEFLGELTIVYE